MRQVSEFELWLAEVLNAGALVVFAAVVVAGVWLAQNWGM